MKGLVIARFAAGACLIFVLCAVSLLPVDASDLDEGFAALRAGEYDAAAEALLPLARANDPTAQNLLGTLYYSGLGVEQDFAESARWFRRSAEQGDADAQKNLGLMYASGWGVEQDYAEALDWLHKAVAQGSTDAQAEIGYFHLHGFGVKQDYGEALELLTSAAEAGSTRAQLILASMFKDGLGVNTDVTEAMRWVRTAAEQGDPMAQYNLAASYALGDGVPQDFAEAMVWYRKSADQGFADAQYRLGWMYEQGEGVEPSEAEAAKWYELAAMQGHPEAQAKLNRRTTEPAAREERTSDTTGYGVTYEDALAAAEHGDPYAQLILGAMYINGDVVGRDYDKANHWLKRSVEGPWGPVHLGKLALGIMYHNALGFPRDYVRACYLFEDATGIDEFIPYNFEQEPLVFLRDRPNLRLSVNWFQQAAEEDDDGAQFCLAAAYLRGLDVGQDHERMIHWFQQAANAGNARAQYYLGHMYTRGEGLTKNNEKSALWLERAAVQGIAAAQTMLAKRYHYGTGVPQDDRKTRYWLTQAIESGDIQAMEAWEWFELGEWERLTYDLTGYEKADKLVKSDQLITVEDILSPETHLTKMIIEGPSADDWVEDLEILRMSRKDAAVTPRAYFEVYRVATEQACPGEWEVFQQTTDSVTFERLTGDCPPFPAQQALFRVLYGPSSAYIIIATRKGVMDADTKAAWLRVLGSASIVITLHTENQP